jgi:hypothetical protein
VSLMGEGLYALASFGATSLDDHDIDDLLVLVREVATARSTDAGSPA